MALALELFTQPEPREVLTRARDRAAEDLARDGLTSHERQEAGYFYAYAEARLVGMTPTEARDHAGAAFPETAD